MSALFVNALLTKATGLLSINHFSGSVPVTVVILTRHAEQLLCGEGP